VTPTGSGRGGGAGPEVWPVRSYPWRAHRTIGPAVAAAGRQPLQPRAAVHSELLAGAVVVGAPWSPNAAVLRVAGDRALHVACAGRDVAWDVHHGGAAGAERVVPGRTRAGVRGAMASARRTTRTRCRARGSAARSSSRT
jgi:hypothetical protein